MQPAYGLDMMETTHMHMHPVLKKKHEKFKSMSKRLEGRNECCMSDRQRNESRGLCALLPLGI